MPGIMPVWRVEESFILVSAALPGQNTLAGPRGPVCRGRVEGDLGVMTETANAVIPNACGVHAARERAATLCDSLLEELAALREEAGTNPYLNPISQLVLSLESRLREGDMDLRDLENVIQLLTVEGFEARAAHLTDYVGEMDPAANTDRLRALFRRMAHDSSGRLRPFDSFAEQVEREALGVVITAHPTFGISATLMRALARLAAGRDPEGAPLDGERRAALGEWLFTTEHRPDDPITLVKEHELALDALAALQVALRQVYDVIFEVAIELYPANWSRLRPRLVTVASWVGYDLDGRADIHWNHTLEHRFWNEIRQLERYTAEVGGLVAEAQALGDGADPALVPTLTLAETRLNLALSTVRAEKGSLPERGNDQEGVSRLAAQVLKGQDTRLTDAGEITALLDQAAAVVTDDDLRRRLLVLAAEMANYGMCMAHSHVRLNANQVHNAIRGLIGMEQSPDHSASRRLYLAALDEHLDRVSPATINYASLVAERATAKRLFMVVAQMLKYVDSVTPVRFLIAEADTPFTVLSALYYAKLFGVADRVDISPLFETDTALERGSDVIRELLENRHYRAYVQQRGRLCIQTGYSDAGRFLGQSAAAMAIERLRMKLARLLGDADLQGVELVIFDTHGESIGRGGHPASLADRLLYLASPASRGLFAEKEVTVKQEISFQGGDGYLFFSDPDLAFATLCRLVEGVCTPADPGREDAFYTETHTSLGFFISVKEFNTKLIDNPDYAALLGSFGVNMFFPTGSRVARRQHEGNVQVAIDHPSQLRAIPHNALLQQLGYLANSIGGIGTAIATDRERFRVVYNESQRLRRILGLVDHANQLSSIHVLSAYCSLFDSGGWLRRLAVESDPTQMEAMQRLTGMLGATSRGDKQQRLLRHLFKDYVELTRALRELNHERPTGRVDSRSRDALDVLHAVRILLIERLFLLAMRVPQVTSQPNVTTAAILDNLLHLDVPDALDVLRRAFPQDAQTPESPLTEAPATYQTHASQGYGREHDRLFQPIEQHYALIRRVTTAVSHWCNAFG